MLNFFAEPDTKDATETTLQEQVILLHGLAESALHMQALEWDLRAAGYGVRNLDYPSTRFDPQTLAENYIRPVIREYASAAKLHVVTHSLGGLLARYCLQQERPANMGRVVMHAPGNHGSPMLELHRRVPLLQALMGPSLMASGVGDESFAHQLTTEIDYELGILAGTVSTDPLANLVLQWPHDGKLQIEDTRLDGMTDFALIPASHDVISFHPLSLWQTRHFLKTGRFAYMSNAFLEARP
ncbi:esterase/lipase family protein [Asticcacaulis tiandongensis]|uniref:esterase/lipase family protein n=1 Tax=Asticcacaulis tiandongensis TaxID=2565365 RepID=UPI001126433D|nr:alpha/beta fold hydrolase [Asticcacaulis tiandongensis]